ncbi:hypothetical protein [Brevundimonas fontaquae]|uniref:Antibiotic biosynthesis monooxygenase n=1 Tax=Brevundimonas fontaquae TaxID=2813778 RepID=A0ABX7LPP3_9CAUL|nr:hypothetical protein [Brevundimonas fontaquae]QSF54783.1 hypothetical protein JX001_02890 [Brevundimonas fontaquae]
MSSSPVFRIDKFVVPPRSRDVFLDRLRMTHRLLDEADGCDQNLVLEQTGGDGRYNVVTFVQWRDASCYEVAKHRSHSAQTTQGFDPAAFMAELGIVADLGDYQGLVSISTIP